MSTLQKNKFLNKNQDLEFRMLCPACCHRLAYASYSGHKQSTNQTQTRKTSLAKTQTPWSDSQGVPSTGSRMLFKNGIMWLGKEGLITCMILKLHSWVICVKSFTNHGDFPFLLMAYLNSGTYLILLILKKVSNLAGKGDKLMVCFGLSNCGKKYDILN